MNEQINNVCKLGQEHLTCRYLTVGPNGFECVKLSGMKRYLDKRVEEKTMTARGDNCPGVTSLGL
jgi:hypothetical protein